MLILEARPQSFKNLFVCPFSKVECCLDGWSGQRCMLSRSNVSLASGQLQCVPCFQGDKSTWEQILLGDKSTRGQISMCFLPAARSCLWLLAEAIFEVKDTELVKDLHSVLTSHDVLTTSPIFYKDKSWLV